MNQPPGTWDRTMQWKEICAGHRSVMAIDDTKRHNGGVIAHASIVVANTRMNSVMKQLWTLKNDLYDCTGCDYFHFRSLFHGQEHYKNLHNDRKRRLEFVESFTQLFAKNDIPIFLAAADVRGEQRAVAKPTPSKTRKGGVSDIPLEDPMAATRLTVFLAALAWMGRHGINRPVSAFIDRSREKPPLRNMGILGQDTTGLRGVFDFGVLDPPALQDCDKDWPYAWLADFAAWSWSRLEGYDERTEPLPEWDAKVRNVLIPLRGQYVELDPEKDVRHIDWSVQKGNNANA